MVVDYSGNAVAQKTGGYVAQNITPYVIEDVSCPSTSLCVAVTRNGTVLRRRTRSWTARLRGL